MKNNVEQSIRDLENMLRDFKRAKAEGKTTNSNEVRAKSILEIEEITQKLESYIQSKPELLEQITGTKIDLARKVEWNEVVRPAHFEEDLAAEIEKLKKHQPSKKAK